jgi:hypothetical protein
MVDRPENNKKEIELTVNLPTGNQVKPAIIKQRRYTVKIYQFINGQPAEPEILCTCDKQGTANLIAKLWIEHYDRCKSHPQVLIAVE